MFGDEIMLPRYTWRGKTYKTIGGLHNRMLKDFPGTGMSFDKDHCVLSTKTESIWFDRTITAEGDSVISDEPKRRMAR